MVAARRARRDESGAAAVELALVAPLLIFLLFAIIGYGYMLSFRQALSQAAAEGSRAAAVAPGVLTPVEKAARARVAVNDALGSYGVSCSDDGRLVRAGQDAGTCVVTIPQTCTSSTIGGLCARVALDYTYRDDSLLPAFPGLGIVLPSNLAYTTEAQVS